MKNRCFTALLLASGLAGTPALATDDAPEAQAAEQARIPFVNNGGIRDWQAEGDDTLYVQDRFRRWYKATLMHRATGLPFAQAIGFETRGLDTFDRFSSVLVDGQRIPVQSLVRVEAPPPTRDKPEKA